MKPLRQKSLAPLHGAEGRISQWIRQSDARLEKIADKAYPPYIGDADAACGIATLIGAIATIISIIWSAKDATMPMFGFIAYAILGVGIWGLVRSHRKDNAQKRSRNSYRDDLVTERATDPLFKRAKLLSEATTSLKGHIARYGEQYYVFDQGLSEIDEAAAEQYCLFIGKATEVVLHGVENFFKADALAEQERRFRESNPDVAQSVTSTALTDLLTQLNEPISVPRGELLPTPAEVLAFEGDIADTEKALRVAEVPVPLVARISS